MRTPRKTLRLGAALLVGVALPAHAENTSEAAPPMIAVLDDVEEELQALLDEYDDAVAAFSELVEAAADDTERRKLYSEKRPRPDDYADGFFEFAGRHAGTEHAAKALGWIATNARGDVQGKAMDALLADHLDSEVMADVAFRFPGDEKGEAMLAELERVSPHRNVRGIACFALAYRKAPPYSGGEWEHEEEYVTLMKRIVEKYADVEWRGRKLGALADGALFSLENLQIGKPAPNIAGEDIDGVTFNLTDYRGKVVMIDFWGHW